METLEKPIVTTEDEKDVEFLLLHLKANPELAIFLAKLLNNLVDYNLRDIITQLKGKDYNRSVDTAKPQEWVNKMIEEMQIVPNYIVWDYNEKSFGAPYNVASDVLVKLTKIAHKTL